MKLSGKKTELIITASTLTLALFLLWIYKFPIMRLPFFWDEGWSYATAIYSMYKNNLCLLPWCLNPDLSRGHPLLFYFMNAAVAKIFGFTPFVMHVFALTVSCSFLILFFFILKQYTNPTFALLATLTLLAQEVFIVQSSFMLPEIFIAELMMLAIWFFLTQRILLYMISASLLVLTKESGLFIVAAIWMVAFLTQVREQRGTTKKTLRSLLIYFFVIAVPALIGIAFYVIQKLTYGWYFYPLHISMMNLSLTSILQHLELIRIFIFVGYCRKVLLSILIIISLLILFYMVRQKKIPDPTILKVTWVMFAVFIFYLLFSSINYVSLRYLIPLLAIYIFLLALWSYQLHIWGFRLLPWLFVVAIGIALENDYSSNPSWIDDVSMNYKDDVVMDQQATQFMESEHAQSQKVFTNYLLRFNLTHPELFYLSGPPFTNVHCDTLLKNADYYIFNNLNESYHDYVKSNDSLQLVKNFEKGKAWCEIYKRTK